MVFSQMNGTKGRFTSIAAIAAAVLSGAIAFADDSTKIELPVVGTFDWAHWAEGEAMRHLSSQQPDAIAPFSSMPWSPQKLSNLGGALKNAAPVSATAVSPASDSDQPISASPILNLRGLRDPRIGGKLDARIVDGAGVSVNELEDPSARSREMKIGFYEGPLKLEAAKSMQTQSQTTSVGTQLLWAKTSLWSRYSPDGRSLGFGLSRPIADGFSLSTQWTESLQDRRVMVGVDANPTAAWNALRSVVR